LTSLTSLAAFFGGPPNTTYSEVTGAVALTRVFNPAVMTWAAIAAILLAFVGKMGALLQTVPAPVMGVKMQAYREYAEFSQRSRTG
jgi:uracil permease